MVTRPAANWAGASKPKSLAVTLTVVGAPPAESVIPPEDACLSGESPAGLQPATVPAVTSTALHKARSDNMRAPVSGGCEFAAKMPQERRLRQPRLRLHLPLRRPRICSRERQPQWSVEWLDSSAARFS